MDVLFCGPARICVAFVNSCSSLRKHLLNRSLKIQRHSVEPQSSIEAFSFWALFGVARPALFELCLSRDQAQRVSGFRQLAVTCSTSKKVARTGTPPPPPSDVSIRQLWLLCTAEITSHSFNQLSISYGCNQPSLGFCWNCSVPWQKIVGRVKVKLL